MNPKIWVLLFIFFAKTLLTQAQFSDEIVHFPTPLSDRVASYDISVELDAEQKMIHAEETLYWKNPSADTVRNIQFHLYLNAFKNSKSTFIQEAGGNLFGTRLADMSDEEWSWIDIDKIANDAGEDWTSHLEFIQPDDDNEHDQTVIQLNLPEPVLPYDSITLHLDFSAKIPKVNVRTGYSKNYFLMVQWFPKVGVYEPAGMRFSKKGNWNCHQYHPTSEYYSTFGVYNVDITVPKNFKVGASGELVKEEENGDRKTYHFHGEDIIDFGWTASPDFMVVEDRWQGVDIRLFILPEYKCCTDRYIGAAKQGLEYMGEHLMEYPFPTLTIVVPPLHGINSGAMEYPTFITAPGMYKFPKWLRSPEYFVLHEFVHQYFMMMVATNEFEEAWMDEGFTSYWKSRVLDHYYGAKNAVVDLPWMHFGAMEFFRSRYTGMNNMSIAESTRAGWEYPWGRERALTYSKPATWLRTLEGLLGRATMDEIMHTFFHRWKFKHPCRYDFIDVVNEVVLKNHDNEFGENMHWFFDQVLYGTEVCDYAVANISNKVVAKKAKGIFDSKGMTATEQDIPENQNHTYESKVTLHRLGGIQIPVDVLVHFENGETILEKWDGKERAFGFIYHTDSKVDYVIIDPEEKIYIDKNFLNNSLRTQPETRTIWKAVSGFFVKMQSAFQGVSFLV